MPGSFMRLSRGGRMMAFRAGLMSRRIANLPTGPGRTGVFNRFQKRAIRKIVQKGYELKWFQPSLSSQAITSAGTVVGMTDIPQGDTDQTRDGDQVSLAGALKLNYQLDVDLGNDILQQTPTIRIVVFQWHPQTESGGATEPTLANLFNNGPSGAPDVYSFFNHDNRFMFTVLLDRIHRLVGPGGATTLAYNPKVSLIKRHIVKYKKRVRRKIQFSAGSTVIAVNHLYICYLSDLAADAQNPTITWTAKLVFHDN